MTCPASIRHSLSCCTHSRVFTRINGQVSVRVCCRCGAESVRVVSVYRPATVAPTVQR